MKSPWVNILIDSLTPPQISLTSKWTPSSLFASNTHRITAPKTLRILHHIEATKHNHQVVPLHPISLVTSDSSVASSIHRIISEITSCNGSAETTAYLNPTHLFRRFKGGIQAKWRCSAELRQTTWRGWTLTRRCFYINNIMTHPNYNTVIHPIRVNRTLLILHSL